ncbi:hypothetical protein ACIRQP_36570 [Streptomyces sp. NPDC102274]|uniref:hypothetical protein n=1 Tax=Streptomyces sp. NPDC102274 TaxID=3366151 RepID=UPI0037FE3928
MADSAAVYGLVGVIGGALLGGAATFAVPVLQNRHAERVRRQSRAEAKFNRLMALRKTTRELVGLLDEEYTSLLAGRAVVRDVTWPALQAALDAVGGAADNLAIDGLHFTLSSSSREVRSPENSCLELLLRHAYAVSGLIREIRDGDGEAETVDLNRLNSAVRRRTVSELAQEMSSVKRARESLMDLAFDHMDGLRDEHRL